MQSIFFTSVFGLYTLFFFQVQAQDDIFKPEIALNLSNINLNELPTNFIDSYYVTALYLNNNRITSISPDAFLKLPNLRSLDMSGNPGTKMYGNYYDRRNFMLFQYPEVLPNLEYLYLRQCNIYNFNVILKSVMPKLKSVDLSYNYITNFPLKGLPPSLTVINLRENQIRNINIDVPINITHLDLSNNKLSSVCKNVYHGCDLSLEGTKNLQYLLLPFNQIETIDEDSFSDSRNLVQLDLSNNKIKFIQNNTFELTNAIDNLTLDNNELTDLPIFSSMTSLTYLSLGSNKIEKINSTCFSNLTNLKSLILKNNLLEIFKTENIEDLTSLTFLDISNNKLYQLSKYWIIPFISIQIVDLSNNSFKSLKDLYLSHTETLTDVFLYRNLISNFNKNDFIDLSENLTIHISHEGCNPEIYEDRFSR